MFKFALRNVLKNKKRSFVTALAITAAAMIIGFSAGWINGLVDEFLQNYYVYQTGHIRVTTQDFYDRERFMPVEDLIYGSDGIAGEIRRIDGVSGVEKRVRFALLLAKGDNTTQAMGMGIDLLTNRLELASKVSSGKIDQNGIVIGSGLAKKLSAGIGDELLLATQTSEGGLNGIKLPITGISDFGLTMIDDNMFFISTAQADKLLKTYGDTTELYVFVKDIRKTEEIRKKIQALLPDGVIAMTFKEQMGEMYMMFTVMQKVYAFIEALIMFLASFVIINTMMMNIFERIHEIGTLKSMGMTDNQLFVNFTLEGAIIGAAGGFAGVVIGLLMIWGIDLAGGINFGSMMEGVDLPIGNVILLRVTLGDVLTAFFISLVVPALTAMIPARYVRKFTAAEALRK